MARIFIFETILFSRLATLAFVWKEYHKIDGILFGKTYPHQTFTKGMYNQYRIHIFWSIDMPDITASYGASLNRKEPK